MRIQRATFTGQAVVSGRGGGQQRCAGEQRQQGGAENRQGLISTGQESMTILMIHHTSE
jgi:hypothetical protein